MSFRNSASLYMMLASTLLYFFAPLAVVVFLYTRWLLLWSLVVAIVRCYIHDDCWLCSWLVSSSVVFGRGLHNVSTSLSWLPYSADSYDLDLSVVFHYKFQWEIWKNTAGKSARFLGKKFRVQSHGKTKVWLGSQSVFGRKKGPMPRF